MSISKPPETAFREALAARGFWRDAVLHDPELGFIMLDDEGTVLSANDNAADILLGATADGMVGRRLHELLPPAIADERLEFVAHVHESERSLLVTSIYRGVRCRCVFRRLPGDAGSAGHVLWTTRRAPIPWHPTDLYAMIDVVEAKAVDWGPLAALSDEERRLLTIIASGATPQDAAARLEQPLDVILHTQRIICSKLQTQNPTRLTQYAIAAGLVMPAPVLMDRV